MISTMSDNQQPSRGHTNRAFKDDDREYVNSVSADLEMGPNGRKIKKIPVKEYTHRDVVIEYVRSCIIKLAFVVALAMIIWTLSCAQVGPSRQTENGIRGAPTTWPNMSQCFGV